MKTTRRRTPNPFKTELTDSDLTDAIRRCVQAYVDLPEDALPPRRRGRCPKAQEASV